MNEPLTINVSVAYVAAGGNARSGTYFYSFDPDIIIVRKRKTTIRFSLDAETEARFVVRELVSSDAKDQFSVPRISADERSISVMNENSVRQLIYVSILVYDTVRDQLVPCDPQVINSPETEC